MNIIEKMGSRHKFVLPVEYHEKYYTLDISYGYTKFLINIYTLRFN